MPRCQCPIRRHYPNRIGRSACCAAGSSGRHPYVHTRRSVRLRSGILLHTMTGLLAAGGGGGGYLVARAILLAVRTLTPWLVAPSLAARRARSCCWESAGRAETSGPKGV